jgi:hypothetical protein
MPSPEIGVTFFTKHTENSGYKLHTAVLHRQIRENQAVLNMYKYEKNS